MRVQPAPRDSRTVTKASTPIREDRILGNYFYKWTPLVIVGTVAILSLPWLGLIALTIISLVALAALALAFVFAPYLLIRAVSLRWHNRSGASPQTAAASSPAKRQSA
jgi:hypothetical protein